MITPECVIITVVHGACNFGQFDLCLAKGIFTRQYRVRYSLSLLLYTLGVANKNAASAMLVGLAK